MTLAERWNGTAWTIQPTPDPTGAQSSYLAGGFVHVRHGVHRRRALRQQLRQTVTLAERWDGTAWTIQPTPEPAGRRISTWRGVSCTSATACTAVGYYRNSAGIQVTLAERWNGTAWTIQSTPNPTGAHEQPVWRESRARRRRRAPPSGATATAPATR